MSNPFGAENADASLGDLGNVNDAPGLQFPFGKACLAGVQSAIFLHSTSRASS